MTRRRVTLKDVAQHVGFSESTVSLVLNNRQGTRISEDTAKKIREGAIELDYSPDPSARGLRMGKTNAIGFISNEVITTRFASAMITGAIVEAQEHDQVLIMSEIGVGEHTLPQAAGTLLDRRVNALVIGQMQAHKVSVPPSSVPTVVVNGKADSSEEATFGSVLPDEYKGGWKAIDYLLQCGHTRIARVGWHENFRNEEESVTVSTRFAGMNDRMRETGLDFLCEIETPHWEAPEGKASLPKLLTCSPTAVVCANDRLAFGVYQSAAEMGLQIGADLSVISFDDEELASYLDPGLTTIRIPYQEMGAAGVRMALAGVVTDVLIPMPFVERASVARI